MIPSLRATLTFPAMDEHGNRNNVVHVKAPAPATPPPAPDATSQIESAPKPPNTKPYSELADARKDSLADLTNPHKLPSIPVPFVVVEKVADQELPAYGDIESTKLPLVATKRAADAEPDFEEVTVDSTVDQEPPKSPKVPLLIVEKVDDKPAHGDDFGKDATPAQKVAHEIRAADATPDRLVISPEPPGPSLEDESLLAEESQPISQLDALDEMSVQSSTDQTSSEDAVYTPSDHEELRSEDELDNGPLLSHEAVPGHRGSELRGGPLLSHEAEVDDETLNELDDGPLLSHETSSYRNGDLASDDDDELDKAPLLSHETDFSDYKGSRHITNSDYHEDDDNLGPQHYGPCDDDENNDFGVRIYARDRAPTFPHEADMHDDDYDSAPLLPHEYSSARASKAGSDFSTEDRSPTFGHETDNTNGLFEGIARPNVFRTRSTSSTLPHKLPRSDAEDGNLNDPSLEQFPTSREQILERVATIGLHLPEDEPIDDQVHSPQFSVLSQACSSVDLVPVKSYTSLASVPEADDSDDEYDDDLDSLGSPSVSLPISRFSRDPHATSMSESRRQLGFANTEPGTVRDRTAISSEADSVDKHDGAKESTSILTTLREAIATPSGVLNPITPPLTPERQSTDKDVRTSSNLDSELRERRTVNEHNTRDTDATSADASITKDKLAKAATPVLAQNEDRRNETFLQNFIRIVFGSVGHLFTACAGDRKRAR